MNRGQLFLIGMSVATVRRPFDSEHTSVNSIWSIEFLSLFPLPHLFPDIRWFRQVFRVEDELVRANVVWFRVRGDGRRRVRRFRDLSRRGDRDSGGQDCQQGDGDQQFGRCFRSIRHMNLPWFDCPFGGERGGVSPPVSLGGHHSPPRCTRLTAQYYCRTPRFISISMYFRDSNNLMKSSDPGTICASLRE